METAFLSYSFKLTPPDLLRQIEDVLAQHDVRPVTGAHLEGRPLTPAVQARIAEADVLIALLTPAAKLGDGTYQPTLWVTTELQHARTSRKPTITLRLPDIADLPGEHEYIDLDPKNPHAALLKLSQTVADWKRSLGRTVKVRLLPRELLSQLDGALRTGNLKACYRLTRTDGGGLDQAGWRPAFLRQEEGGIFAFLKEVTDDTLIEMEVSLPAQTWRSVATPQWLHVELKQEVAQ